MTLTAPDDTALLLTVPEAAERLRVHASTLRKLITDEKLECVRIGRKVLVAPDQLEDFVNASRRYKTQPTAEELARAEAEANAARADTVLALQAEAARRAENPWGRSTRGKRRTAA